jgi:folate-binding protein YgfZ
MQTSRTDQPAPNPGGLVTEPTATELPTATATEPDSGSTLEVPLASLAITGPDAFRFIQGQVTNDLNQLTDTTQLLAAICTPDGKLVTIMSIQQVNADHLRLITYSEHLTLLSERLSRFRIRVKAEIHPEEVGWLVDTDPRPNPLWPLDSRLLATTNKGEIADVDHFTRSRLTRLATHLPVDAPTDLLVAGVPALVANGVSFTKGCYVGQELVARTDSRNAKPPISLFVCRFTPTSCEPFTSAARLPLNLSTESDDNAGEVRALLVEDTSVVISGWVKRKFASHAGLLIDGLPGAAPIPVALAP